MEKAVGAIRMDGGTPPQQCALREERIIARDAHCIIAGHTHTPQEAYLGRPDSHDQHFVDTGTWRKRFLPCHDASSFGEVKAITYVTVFDDSEVPGAKEVPFSLWMRERKGW